MTSPLGDRIQIVGPTNAGKSTLATHLGTLLDLPATDLDAIYWKPDWTGSADEEWHPQLRAIAAADRWIVAGDYFRHTTANLWPRLETMVWLDLPLRVVLPRIVTRSWRRWRSRELLWGTNRENFWQQFKVWNPDSSLIGYAVRTRSRRPERILTALADPRYTHIRLIRLRSTDEVEAFTRSIEEACRLPS